MTNYLEKERLMIASITLLVFLAFALASVISVLKRSPSSKSLDRFTVCFCLLSGLFALLYSIILILSRYGSLWDCIRLAPAFMYVHGIPLYSGPTAGVVSGHIYGPLAALIYAPSAVFTSMKAALVSAEAISLCLSFLPILLTFAIAGRDDRNTFMMGFFLFFYCAITFLSLFHTLFPIHADAPALSLGAFSCMALYFRRKAEDRRLLFISALCAVLACWTKQSMAPLIAAHGLYIAYTEGKTPLLRYLLYLLASTLITSSVFLALFDAKGMYFNMHLPFMHPLRWDYGTTRNLLVEYCYLLVLLAIPFALMVLSPCTATFRQRMGENRWTLFALTGMALLPPALVGRMKTGGALNAFAYTTYYLAAAGALAYAELMAELRKKQEQPLFDFIRLSLIIFLCLGFGVQSIHLAAMERDMRDDPFNSAVSYIKAHRGEIYFPGNPLLHVMAENRFYHQGYGIFDRELAGSPLDSAHFFSHIPERITMVAVSRVDHTLQDRYVFKYLPEFTKRIDIPELPDWDVYVREDREK